MKGIPVLYEDDHFLVLNKPAGLPVQGGAGVGLSLDAILAAAREKPPLLVHRLDKDTSGVIVTAKTKESAAACAALFFNHQGLKKTYIAVCAGLPEATGVINEKLFVKGRVLDAKTFYKLLAGRKELQLGADTISLSLVELELGTGRMHQIRRHLAGSGSPILGDDKYGDFALNRKLKKTFGLKRLLLHASALYLPPSLVKGGIEVSAPPPDHFCAFMKQTGLASGSSPEIDP